MRESIEEEDEEKKSSSKRFSTNLSSSRTQPPAVEVGLNPHFVNNSHLLSIRPQARSSRGLIFENNSEEAKLSPKNAYS